MEDWYWLGWFGWDRLLSFRWEFPFVLYGLAALPILLWLRTLFHRPIKQRLTVAYERVPDDWLTRLRYLTPVLIGLGVAMLLVALARPQLVTDRFERISEGIDLMVLLDISDSMIEADIPPSRLEAAKKVAKDFIRGRTSDRVGLVIFAGEAFSICPLTTDHQLLFGFLDEITPAMIRTAGTAIGTAIAVGINRMRDSPSPSKVMILISDGDSNTGPLNPLITAPLADAFGVRIYTVVVGIPKAARSNQLDTLDVPQAAGVDENTLRQIAQRSKGRFFKATDTRMLSTAFEQIDRLEKTTYEDKHYYEVTDCYRVYLRWGLLFMMLGLLTKAFFVANVLED